MTAAASSSTGHTHCTRTAAPTTTPNDSCTEGQGGGRGEGGEGIGERGERIVGGGGLRERPMTIVHVNERCRKREERSKQGQTNNKTKQHSTPKPVTFPKLPQVGLDP